MNCFESLYNLLQREIPELELRREEPMSRHTTFKVGGPAALMVLPATEAQLVNAVELARMEGTEPLFVGLGSNLLVDDCGLNALVIKTAPQLNACRVDGNRITAWAGAPLAQVANAAADHALTGLEFAHGIPGSLGGAVVMDAGAYDGEMRQVVRSVRALNQRCDVEELTAEQCEFGYRHSVFSNGSRLVLSAVMELQPGDEAAIRGRMAELMEKRKSKQPLEWPSAGSTFKRPEGYFAAALIDQCGLKEFRIGGAQVSEKHAGFVINAGGATCRDILELMDAVRERVFRETGVELEPEVKYLR
jgi:UDP-N-acetylmuramate dehydrogenase